MKVALEFDVHYAGEEGIEDAIISHAADKLIAGTADGHSIVMELRKRINAIRDEEIRALVKPLVADALAASLQPTSKWGEPEGPPVSATQVIVNEATKYLTQETGDYNHRETTVRKFIREEVERAVSRELKAALDVAKAQVVTAVQAEGAKVLAETITRMAGVR